MTGGPVGVIGRRHDVVRLELWMAKQLGEQGVQLAEGLRSL